MASSAAVACGGNGRSADETGTQARELQQDRAGDGDVSEIGCRIQRRAQQYEHSRGKAGAQWSGAQCVLTDGAEATTPETRADIAKRILLAEKRIDQLLVVQKVRCCRAASLAWRRVECSSLTRHGTVRQGVSAVSSAHWVRVGGDHGAGDWRGKHGAQEGQARAAKGCVQEIGVRRAEFTVLVSCCRRVKALSVPHDAPVCALAIGCGLLRPESLPPHVRGVEQTMLNRPGSNARDWEGMGVWRMKARSVCLASSYPSSSAAIVC